MTTAMPTILRRLPFYDHPTTLRIPGGPAIQIGQDQIVIWVTLAPISQRALSQPYQPFPALLDTGYNGSFLLREDHLAQWARMNFDEANFPFLRSVRIRGVSTPTFDADLWLHSNIAGFRDQFSQNPPSRIDLVGGVAVCPESKSEFHLPLLGMAAVRKNRLRLLVNGEKRYITLRTPFASPVEERGTT